MMDGETAELRAQILENCKFFCPPDAKVGLVMTWEPHPQDPQGTYRIIVLQTDADGRHELVSKYGPSIQAGLKSTWEWSAVRAKQHIQKHGTDLVAPGPSSGNKKHGGGVAQGVEPRLDSEGYRIINVRAPGDGEALAKDKKNKKNKKSKKKAKKGKGHDKAANKQGPNNKQGKSEEKDETRLDDRGLDEMRWGPNQDVFVHSDSDDSVGTPVTVSDATSTSLSVDSEGDDDTVSVQRAEAWWSDPKTEKAQGARKGQHKHEASKEAVAGKKTSAAAAGRHAKPGGEVRSQDAMLDEENWDWESAESSSSSESSSSEDNDDDDDDKGDEDLSDTDSDIDEILRAGGTHEPGCPFPGSPVNMIPPQGPNGPPAPSPGFPAAGPSPNGMYPALPNARPPYQVRQLANPYPTYGFYGLAPPGLVPGVTMPPYFANGNVSNNNNSSSNSNNYNNNNNGNGSQVPTPAPLGPVLVRAPRVQPPVGMQPPPPGVPQPLPLLHVWHVTLFIFWAGHPIQAPMKKMTRLRLRDVQDAALDHVRGIQPDRPLHGIPALAPSSTSPLPSSSPLQAVVRRVAWDIRLGESVIRAGKRVPHSCGLSSIRNGEFDLRPLVISMGPPHHNYRSTSPIINFEVDIIKPSNAPPPPPPPQQQQQQQKQPCVPPAYLPGVRGGPGLGPPMYVAPVHPGPFYFGPRVVGQVAAPSPALAAGPMSTMPTGSPATTTTWVPAPMRMAMGLGLPGMPGMPPIVMPGGPYDSRSHMPFPGMAGPAPAPAPAPASSSGEGRGAAAKGGAQPGGSTAKVDGGWGGGRTTLDPSAQRKLRKARSTGALVGKGARRTGATATASSRPRPLVEDENETE